MFAATVAAVLILTGPQAAGTPAAAAYRDALRCAGLTQAASELEGGESAEGRGLYDAALYWSLTAGQAGRIAGRSTAATEGDQTRARILAVRELSADDADARADLQRCRSRAPRLG